MKNIWLLNTILAACCALLNASAGNFSAALAWSVAALYASVILANEHR